MKSRSERENNKKRPGSGEDVFGSRFGEFGVRGKNGRKCRNPAAGRIVIFKYSGKWGDRLNG
jgi:nucleoid DNA-binding protein